MNPMLDFDKWYDELVSDQIWSMPAMMQHKEETFKQIARKVYMSALADRERGSLIPMTDHRRHVYNIVCKTPGDRPKEKPWYEKALEKKLQEDEQKEGWKPVSWDKRAEYLKQVQAEIDKITNNKIRPLFAGEAEAKGQYDLPKPKATGAPSAPVEVIVEHINKVNTARRKYFLERNPDASEEEIMAYLKKFDAI